MNATPQRRRLLPVSAVLHESLPEDTVSKIAARNGFQTIEPVEMNSSDIASSMPTPPKATSFETTPAEMASAAATGTRRKRQLTGRDHQFNTRLRRDTLDYIYGEANERNIPIAQVIEEGMEALKRARSSV